MSWNSSNCVVHLYWCSFSLATHCYNSFNSASFITYTTRGTVLSGVLNVANCLSGSCNCVVSCSNCSSWTTLPQNCVVTSVTCFSSFSMSSNCVVASSMALFRASTTSGGLLASLVPTKSWYLSYILQQYHLTCALWMAHPDALP